MSIASEIRAEMARKKLTVAELADGAGISRASLSRKLHEHTELTLAELVRIAYILGTTASDLMRRTEIVEAA